MKGTTEHAEAQRQGTGKRVKESFLLYRVELKSATSQGASGRSKSLRSSWSGAAYPDAEDDDGASGRRRRRSTNATATATATIPSATSTRTTSRCCLAKELRRNVTARGEARSGRELDEHDDERRA